MRFCSFVVRARSPRRHSHPSAISRFSALKAAFVLLCAVLLPAAVAAQEVIPGEFLLKVKEQKGVARSVRAAELIGALGFEELSYNAVNGSHHVRISDSKSRLRLAKELVAAGEIEYIEPNYRVSIHAAPNDPRLSELWGLHNTAQTGGTADVDIDAPEAWNLTTGSESVVVGIVDTGINYLHPDLQANVWVNTGEIPGNGIDDDLNGVIDDVHGFNAITGSGDPLDDQGHGTHCAGTIGGHGNNGQGVVGVNWKVKMMGLKFLDASGFGSTQNAIKAIEYAVKMKDRGVNLKVLNNSWGGSGYSRALEDAIRAANTRGILFVAAAGNNGSDNDLQPNYPSSYGVENVVSVAAVDHDGNLANFSNFGASSVDLAGPGVQVLSTFLGAGYKHLSGTSMATPHVTGVAALIASREPALGISDVKTRLLETAKPLAGLQGLVRVPALVDADGALTNARSNLPPLGTPVRYRVSSGPLDYRSALGTRVLSKDDGYAVVALDFSLPYFGGNFERLAVSSNGRVVPLAAGAPTPSLEDFSNRALPGIAPYHDDLYPSTVTPAEGGVWYRGDAREAVITWVVVSYVHRNRGDNRNELRFQLRLSADGAIEFHYLDTQSGDALYDYGQSATVSIAPVPGSRGEPLTVSHNTADPSMLHRSMLRLTTERRYVSKDYDGDGISDIALWRPASGMWFILTSQSGYAYPEHEYYQLGLPGDIPLSGDFDGDSRADLVVWRPSDGTWYIRRSSERYAHIHAVQWGLPGDVPLVADHDGDLLSDLVVYRSETAQFYALLSSSGYDRNGALFGGRSGAMAVTLGGPGHDLVSGDFTGDGRAEFAVVWQLVRFWTALDFNGQLLFSLPWGEPGDTPLACDTDGDRVSDRFVVRLNPAGGYDWFGALSSGGVQLESFGSFGDLPACEEEYDGDGRGDLRLFRPHEGRWYIRSSAEDTLRAYSFGLPGDLVPR